MNKNNYNAVIEIRPESSYLSCSGTLSYIVKQRHTKEISFYLYKGFTIDEIDCSCMEKYIFEETAAQWCPFVVESRRLVITLETPVNEGQELEIYFRYHGKMGLVSQWETNRITGDFVELGIYSPWFPLTSEMDETLFCIDVTIPLEYHVISSGMVSKITDGQWRIIQDVPSNDCTIISGKDIKSIPDYNSDKIWVYYFEEDKEEICKEIHNESIWLKEYYTQRFGKTASGNLSIVIPKRRIGGGYCRTGLVVIGLGSDSYSVDMRFLGHEISHLWWNKAQNTNSWEDWLNESFAEYSALMAIRERLGEDEFEKRIRLYMESSASLPPIMGLNRQDERAYQVLYKKGPVILYRLELMTGKESFQNLLRQIHLNKIGGTQDLLELVEKIMGAKYSDFIKAELEK